MRNLTLIFAVFSSFWCNKLIAQAPSNPQEFFSKKTNWTVAELGTLVVSKQFTDNHNGVTHIYGSQQLNGIAIHPAYFDLHFQNNVAVSDHHQFINLKQINVVNGDLDLNTALDIVVKTGNNESKNELAASHDVKRISENEYTAIEPLISEELIKISRLYYLNQSSNRLVLCWVISYLTKDHSNWFNYYVSTQNGEILEIIDWTNHCSKAEMNSTHYPVINGHSTQSTLATPNSYNVFKIPVESPIYGNRTVVTNPADTAASPFGWHDVNGTSGAEYTITRGNNVFARDDKDNNNTGGYSPDGGNDLIFDAAFEIDKPASDYLDAAVINLFYMNNTMHDVWYQYGFTEAAGNFQQNNYGKGGVGNDFVYADAQDGSGTNNANFSTPADGTNPRMQMFLWTGGAANAQLITVHTPVALKGKYSGIEAGFTPQLTTTPINGKLVLVSSLTSGSLGCDSITNASAIKNNIALIDRGNCTFVEKIQKAQDAGALAVIIANNNGAPISMGGSGTGIKIPALMISQSDGNLFKAQISNNITLTLYDSTGVAQKVFDSDFDNGVIAHEYGHGISTRLTGGASNSNCLTNQEQMGEGWSDFFALVMTHENGDKGSDLRGIGNYLTGEGTNGNGIRTYQYSTNKAISKYTYNDIKTLSVPHGVGSVWSAMLWDLYWKLIDKYGYDTDIYRGKGGNNIAMQLVIDGLKLQPCNPGFADGRDAILLADRLNNNGKNQLLIWEVFAARGLGYSANQGSSGSRSDGTEGYDIPPQLNHTPTITKSANSEVTSSELLNYQIKIWNNTPNVLYNIVCTDTLQNDVLFNAGSGCKINQSGNVLTITADSMQSGDSLTCLYSVKLDLNKYTSIIQTDSFEQLNLNWTITSDLGTNVFKLAANKFKSGKNSLFVNNAASASDQSASNSFSFTGMAKPAISFYNYINAEDGWDGGVVEFREKGSTVWTDVNGRWVKGGYQRVISVNPASRISGQPAFSGNSNGFFQSLIDFSDYAGKEIELRFRFVSDGAAAEEGWYIDDVSVYDLYTVNNKAMAVAKDGDFTESETVTIVFKGEGGGVSVNNFEAVNLFKLYPNPSSNYVSIYCKNNLHAQLEVRNQLGQLFYAMPITESTVKLNVSYWQPGVYYFYIRNNTESRVVKFIKN